MSRNNSRHNSLSNSGVINSNSNQAPNITLMNLNHSGSVPPQSTLHQRQFFTPTHQTQPTSMSHQRQHHAQCQQRSFSSCGEPVNHHYYNTSTNNVYSNTNSNQSPPLSNTTYVHETRRCMSNRASPIRQVNTVTNQAWVRPIDRCI